MEDRTRDLTQKHSTLHHIAQLSKSCTMYYIPLVPHMPGAVCVHLVHFALHIANTAVNILYHPSLPQAPCPWQLALAGPAAHETQRLSVFSLDPGAQHKNTSVMQMGRYTWSYNMVVVSFLVFSCLSF